MRKVLMQWSIHMIHSKYSNTGPCSRLVACAKLQCFILTKLVTEVWIAHSMCTYHILQECPRTAILGFESLWPWKQPSHFYTLFQGNGAGRTSMNKHTQRLGWRRQHIIWWGVLMMKPKLITRNLQQSALGKGEGEMARVLLTDFWGLDFIYLWGLPM